MSRIAEISSIGLRSLTGIDRCIPAEKRTIERWVVLEESPDESIYKHANTTTQTLAKKLDIPVFFGDIYDKENPLWSSMSASCLVLEEVITDPLYPSDKNFSALAQVFQSALIPNGIAIVCSFVTAWKERNQEEKDFIEAMKEYGFSILLDESNGDIVEFSSRMQATRDVLIQLEAMDEAFSESLTSAAENQQYRWIVVQKQV